MTTQHRRRPEGPRPWHEAPIEAGRVLRARGLSVSATRERGVFLVSGGDEEHWVNFAHLDAPVCDCHDAIARDQILCKHATAVLLWKRDRRARRHLRRAQAAETLALATRRARCADRAYASFAAAQEVTPLPVPWQVDADGRWWRPVRDGAAGEPLVTITFAPQTVRVGSVWLVPF